MNNSISEVVKEYVLDVEGLYVTVKGRISKTENNKFRWQISHYCKPSETAAGVYRPSNTTFNSFDEAERELKLYMNSFTTIDVTPNEYY
ncbi:MAG: hypothetical protein AB1414_19425 [bacterium]